MNANTIRSKATRTGMASFTCGIAIVLAACGATAAQQSAIGPESQGAAAEPQTSAGSFSLDYDTAQHMGRLELGAGSSSLDYNTAQHVGRVEMGAGSFSLDYDTARHMGRLP
ncbi:MAG: hypothetical protein E6I18_12545 [Chloroflexi bacterium]|nr:MAG: hypothetical protein E6I18_12545 [Chloroflexota bacterium]